MLLGAGKPIEFVAAELKTFREGCYGSCLRTSNIAQTQTEAESEGGMTMRVLLILAAISFSAAAFAQSAPPRIGDKPLVQVKPKGPTGCKAVGRVNGTKLWADCVVRALGARYP